MKLKTTYYLLILSTLFLLLDISNINAQPGSQRQSPKITTNGKIGTANVSITYGSPSVKGRKIWGGLVPYGKVWRAGANEATIIETDKDLMVGGKKLLAGKYSLYILPNENEWQVIINTQTGQWGIERSGETTRNPATDVLTVTAKPIHTSLMSESLLYQITPIGLIIKWENEEITIPIKQ